MIQTVSQLEIAKIDRWNNLAKISQSNSIKYQFWTHNSLEILKIQYRTVKRHENLSLSKIEKILNKKRNLTNKLIMPNNNRFNGMISS